MLRQVRKTVSRSGVRTTVGYHPRSAAKRRGERQGARALDTVASLTREPEKARSLAREPRHGGAIGCKRAQTRPAGLETRNPESSHRFDALDRCGNVPFVRLRVARVERR